jgi:hypothetical protein
VARVLGVDRGRWADRCQGRHGGWWRPAVRLI